MLHDWCKQQGSVFHQFTKIRLSVIALNAMHKQDAQR